MTAPIILTTLRVCLAPLLIIFAFNRISRAAYVVCLVLALVSDILDGVIARRRHIVTAFLRRYDSIADTIFYLAAGCAVWILYPEVLKTYAVSLALLLALEVVRYVVDFRKFGREASYHMWSAKCWNLVLFAALLSLLGFGVFPWMILVAIWLGILTDLEGLLASLLLPVWTHDVPNVLRAYRIRQHYAQRS